MCVKVLPVCLCTPYVSGVCGDQKRISGPLELKLDSCKLPCGCWESNLGPSVRTESALDAGTISPDLIMFPPPAQNPYDKNDAGRGNGWLFHRHWSNCCSCLSSTVQIQVEEEEDDTEESSSKEGWAPREQLPANGRACASCLLSHRIKLQECVGMLSASLMDQWIESSQPPYAHTHVHTRIHTSITHTPYKWFAVKKIVMFNIFLSISVLCLLGKPWLMTKQIGLPWTVIFISCLAWWHTRGSTLKAEAG